MSTLQADLLIECGNQLGEMPQWDALSRSLYWIDVPAPGRLLRFATTTNELTSRHFPHALTSLARSCNSGWLIADETRIWRADPEGSLQETLLELPPTATPQRFNDGAVDSAGRFWIGSMPNNLEEPARSARRLERTGGVHVLLPDGSASFFPEGFGCPNAICWSPDDTVLYAADSVSGWLYAYEFDRAAAQMRRRREFCRLSGLGIPDGAAIDKDGCLWNARWGAGVVARIDPAGRLMQTVALPVSNPTACCFGGPLRNILYVTSARYGLSPEQLAHEPLAGSVFAIETATKGLVPHCFGQT
jgi:sugar lactone lactonase YvrE